MTTTSKFFTIFWSNDGKTVAFSAEHKTAELALQHAQEFGEEDADRYSRIEICELTDGIIIPRGFPIYLKPHVWESKF